MPSWKAFETEEPELAAVVQRLFDAGRHKTMATVRADGAPRISGIECVFEDGELRFGSMPNARKEADLERDPRFAIHSPTSHPGEGKDREWTGEAKIAGRATRADDGIFVADITEVVFTHLDDEATKLVVEWWTPKQGRRIVERD